MKTRIQQGFTLIELLVVITIIAILASLAVPTFAKIQEKGNMSKGINNAKQIILSLKLYASDNNSSYPDSVDPANAVDANTAFKALFVAGVCNTEQIFGCPQSKANPDGKYKAAGAAGAVDITCLAAGENHWQLVKGLADSSSGPAVCEVTVNNVATGATWDPTKAGKTDDGRTWSAGKVIVGLNDSSVSALPVANLTAVSALKVDIFANENSAYALLQIK